MKLTTAMLTVGLLLTFAIVARVSSDEGAGNEKLLTEVNRLRQDVSALQRQVDYLMADHRLTAEDIKALEERAENAKSVQERTIVMFEAGEIGAGMEAVSQANLALKLAEAEVAFAKREYDGCLQHLDSAVAAAKQYRRIRQNQFEAGTVTLDRVISAQQAVLDTELHRSHKKKKIAILVDTHRE